VDPRAAAAYGDAFADVYDDWYPDVTDAAACVDRVAALASASGGGPVLELGAGTGRLALPLAARGLDVVAVDASAAMLARLRAKPGSDRVRVIEADMSALDAPDTPALPTDVGVVLVAYNTLFNLPDDAAQRACLTAVARRLRPGGRLVVEAFVPADDRDRERAVSVSRFDPSEVVFSVSVHDPGAQVVVGRHVQVSARGGHIRPWRLHYLRPSELDAMAAAAGLVLEDRWSDWRCTAFDDHSATHVSVYLR
jgi:SAM-dependent methyltransferase